jgi:hypothetical protein
MSSAFITLIDQNGYKSFRYLTGKDEAELSKQLQHLHDYWVLGINNTMMIHKKALTKC